MTAAWADLVHGRYRAFGRHWSSGQASCSGTPGSWAGTSEQGLSSTAPWSSAPSVGGQRPWEGAGVTATVSVGSTLYVFSRDRYFALDVSSGDEAAWSWTDQGDLHAAWAGLPAVEGRGLLEGAGITASWRTPNGRVVLVSVDRYWTFDASGGPGAWSNVASGRVQDLAVFAGIPEVAGGRPWQGPGVTAAWFDTSRRIFGVASGDRYWLADVAAADTSRWLWVAQGMLAHENAFTRVEGLTILTYNIASAMDGVYDHPGAMLAKLAGFIREHRVDVAGLQEVDVGTSRHARADMPTILLDELSAAGYPMHGRFENRFGWYGGQFGNMVLSTRPLENYGAQQVVNNVVMHWFTASLCAGPVRLVNYHPFPGDAACAATDPHYLRILAEHQDQMSVLTGDFNAGPTWSCYGALTTDYDDVCVGAGDASCDNTVDVSWHPGHPLIRIDHIFYHEGAVAPFAGAWRPIWAFSDHRINEGLAVSDHFPLLARIVYVAPTP